MSIDSSRTTISKCGKTISNLAGAPVKRVLTHPLQMISFKTWLLQIGFLASTPTLWSVGKNRMPPVRKPVLFILFFFLFLFFPERSFVAPPFCLKKLLSCHLLFALFHRVDPIDFSISRMIFLLSESTDHYFNYQLLRWAPQAIVSRQI